MCAVKNEIQEKRHTTHPTLFCSGQEQYIFVLFKMWFEKRTQDNWMGY